MSAKAEERYADAAQHFKRACTLMPESRISALELENAARKSKEQKK
jgi:hypothetical protein